MLEAVIFHNFYYNDIFLLKSTLSFFWINQNCFCIRPVSVPVVSL